VKTDQIELPFLQSNIFKIYIHLYFIETKETE